MKTPYRDKQFAAVRVQAGQSARARAADRFRQRQLDASLKRLLRLATKPAEPDERPPP